MLHKSINLTTNVRNFSRVWRVWSGLSLQTCATFLAFGMLLCVERSKREEFTRLLFLLGSLKSLLALYSKVILLNLSIT